MNNLTAYTTWANQIAGKQGYWHAVCACHTTTAKVSLENLAKVAFLLQVDPSTNDGITKVNHDIFRRLSVVA